MYFRHEIIHHFAQMKMIITLYYAAKIRILFLSYEFFKFMP